MARRSRRRRSAFPAAHNARRFPVTAAERRAFIAAGRIRCLLCGREFRAVGWKHLRCLHGYEGEHPVLDYKADFRMAFATCRDTRRSLCQMQQRRWEASQRRWSRRHVLAAIRARAARGQSLAPSAVPDALERGAIRHFGRWETALARLGIDYDGHRRKKRRSRALIVAAVRARAAAGRPLAYTDVLRDDSALVHSALDRFGRSWGRVLRAAGERPEVHLKRRRGEWNLDTVSEWVRARAARGVVPRYRDAPPRAAWWVNRRVPGGWAGLLASLSLPLPEGAAKRRDWTKRAVVAEIRRRRDAGRPLNVRAVKRDGRGLWTQGRNRFGSWDAALRAARVDPGAVRLSGVWSPARVVAAIRARRRAGLPLASTVVRRADPPLHRAASRLFGGAWGNAMRAANLDPARYAVDCTRWTRAAAVAWVRAQAARGRSVAAKDAPQPLVRGVKAHLRIIWADFVRSLRVPYPTRTGEVWTRAVVVERLRARVRRGASLSSKVVNVEEGPLYRWGRTLFGGWDAARRAATAGARRQR